MGSRNYDLGARDMKAAGRIALERGMCSFGAFDIGEHLVFLRPQTPDGADGEILFAALEGGAASQAFEHVTTDERGQHRYYPLYYTLSR